MCLSGLISVSFSGEGANDRDTDTHALTEVCWKKCITGTIRGGKLEKSEETCLSNCVERVLDINFLTVKHLEKMRQQ